MFAKTFILYQVAHFIIAIDVGDKCKPNNQISDGRCTSLENCEIAMRAVINRKPHGLSRCGFKGINEVVCCPETVNKFGPSTNNKRIAERECQKLIESTIPPLSLHITGGEAASIGEFPHMVAMGYPRENLSFDCGGTLISTRYVLTAAHCVDTIDRIVPSMVRIGVVELGSQEWDANTDYRVERIIMHPSYTRQEKYHDIALLRLDQDVTFTTNANAACLYTDLEDPTIELAITGWGQTGISEVTRSGILLKANVSVVPRSKCSPLYANWRKLPQGISNEQLCAGDPDGIRDTCKGDSGGPLQGLTSEDGHYRIIGVTSFGRSCATKVPGVYTRVAQYLDWIESVVWSQ